MKNIFKKNETSESTGKGIRILKKTKPNVCGGTDAYLDEKAPKTIKSDKMICFSATSALGTPVLLPAEENQFEELYYFSAFALPSSRGSFLFLEKGAGFRRTRDKEYEWALVKEDIFPKLVELVRKDDLAKDNGYHSETHGLPENFGGSVDIEYESGERINFSDNQSPIVRTQTAAQIIYIFDEAMKGEKVVLPDASSLRQIVFEETRDKGGFTKATLNIDDKGEGNIERSARYDDPTVYTSRRKIDAHTVSQIKETIKNTGLFAWTDLPESNYRFGSNKKMTFLLADGTSITVDNKRRLPQRIDRGFFNIELELTTRS